MYYRWVVWSISITAIIYTIIFTVYIFVDPEQIFNKSITRYKFAYTNYYSKHQYERLKHKRYSLIFGTSRSQSISSRELNRSILNFHNIYGEPSNIFNFLKQLSNQQIKNIDHIYYLVSLETMRDGYNGLDYSKYGLWDRLIETFPLNSLNLKYLIRDIVYNIRQESIRYYIYEDGSQFVINTNQTTMLNQKNYQNRNSAIEKNNSIKSIIAIDNFCKKHKIKITYYTPTYSDKYIINYDNIYFLWKNLLDNGIDGFYCVYYIQDISDKIVDNHYIYFSDSSHLNYFSMNRVFKSIIFDENRSHFIKDIKQLDICLKKYKDNNESYR